MFTKTLAVFGVVIGLVASYWLAVYGRCLYRHLLTLDIGTTKTFTTLEQYLTRIPSSGGMLPAR